ncbi:helix-turn-helix domain-containing protein [bacterium]|nr:helix-turn-helix domain-containing protein [bacterium]
MKRNETICPACGTLGAKEVLEKESVEVRGEEFVVDGRFWRCPTCSAEFDDSRPEGDPLVAAYRAYREKHGLLQPEEIVAFRKNCGYTQKELAAELGWGEVTLSRYENGALQSKSHEVALRMFMDLQVLRREAQESSRRRMRRLAEDRQKREYSSTLAGVRRDTSRFSSNGDHRLSVGDAGTIELPMAA